MSQNELQKLTLASMIACCESLKAHLPITESDSYRVDAVYVQLLTIQQRVAGIGTRPASPPSAAEVELPELDVTREDVARAMRDKGTMTDGALADHQSAARYCRERQLLAALRTIAEMKKP